MEANILNELVFDLDRFWAHLPDKENAQNGQKPELLLEHTQRVHKYFNQIWQDKRIDEIIDDFWQVIDQDLSIDSKHLLQEMIWGVAIFHDIGKINPNFQHQKMKNKIFNMSTVIPDSNHSFLSAVLYIDYFHNLVVEKQKYRPDKAVLIYFLICNAYIISRHHSSLHSILAFFKGFKSGDEAKKTLNLRLTEISELINDEKLHLYKTKVSWPDSMKKIKFFARLQDKYVDVYEKFSLKQSIYMYTYERLIYSILLASDFYATSEYQNGVKIQNLGDIDEIAVWRKIYEETPLLKNIRMYQQTNYPQNETALQAEKDINNLRSEIFCEAEAKLLQNAKQNIFYLEAPTGSGKSNTAINLSFQLMKQDARLKKIFYIYPFNTLVDQNIECLNKIFGNNTEIMQNIAVINSLTPIKVNKQDLDKVDEKSCYQKALLDRQFLNYPMVLSTHVSLFNTMFSNDKDDGFGFYQLVNSVIVLDEIQSYRNEIWSEIINFLTPMANLLHMKIIIMSATLPNLDYLLAKRVETTNLLSDREKYFTNDCFKKRVELSYELLQTNDKGKIMAIDIDCLNRHLQQHISNFIKPKKVLIEFIRKETAYEFWHLLKNNNLDYAVELLTGDDSLAERQRILTKVKHTQKTIVLIATQVIEAGVDISADIGYKNISKLDSEEQFLGRINRSCTHRGITYFFKIDEARTIYKNDKRTDDKFTLVSPNMRDILINKNFQAYYDPVLADIRKKAIESCSEDSIGKFFQDEVAPLNFVEIGKRMQLITNDIKKVSVFLARVLKDRDGNLLDGAKIWEEFEALLKAKTDMDYAEWKVKLSEIRSIMNEFIYEVTQVTTNYDDKIGELYYIKNGEQFIKDNKLERKKIEGKDFFLNMI